jgi:hypothetical protein
MIVFFSGLVGPLPVDDFRLLDTVFIGVGPAIDLGVAEERRALARALELLPSRQAGAKLLERKQANTCIVLHRHPHLWCVIAPNRQK